MPEKTVTFFAWSLYAMRIVTFSPDSRVNIERVREPPLCHIGQHAHRPGELCQQPQHPEEGHLQEEDVPQRRPLLPDRVHQVGALCFQQSTRRKLSVKCWQKAVFKSCWAVNFKRHCASYILSIYTCTFVSIGILTYNVSRNFDHCQTELRMNSRWPKRIT